MTYRDDPIGCIVTRLLVVVAAVTLLVAIGLQDGTFIVGALLGLVLTIIVAFGHSRANPETDGWW